MATYRDSRKAETRTRILEAAARLIARKGLDGAGVAEVMAEAGLTHGGFYAHFPSKEAMLGEACRLALHDHGTRVKGPTLAREGVEGLIETYLSTAHRDELTGSCPLAAMASELARAPEALRAQVFAGGPEQLDWLAVHLPGLDAEAKRQAAAGLLATLLGGVVAARIGAASPAGDWILEAVKGFARAGLEKIAEDEAAGRGARGCSKAEFDAAKLCGDDAPPLGEIRAPQPGSGDEPDGSIR